MLTALFLVAFVVGFCFMLSLVLLQLEAAWVRDSPVQRTAAPRSPVAQTPRLSPNETEAFTQHVA